MKNSKLILSVLLLLAVSLSCKLLNRTGSRNTSKGPAIDFVTRGTPLNVTVQLDKKQTASRMIPRAGGTVSLNASDGSKFTLDVPAEALESDTMITMTAVKSLDGAPLANNTPTAVQLEPSGLFFKEMATLTIVPAKEIPTNAQIIFAYEGEGQDYHLAVIDPRSKEIKIKLMHFSGAGVGSGSDSEWAATLQLQADSAYTRLAQKLGEVLQPERLKMIPEDKTSLAADEQGETVKSILDQFEDQVVLKEIAAAELDCKHARKALEDLLYLGRLCRLLSVPLPDHFAEKALRLEELARKCSHPSGSKRSYRVSGQSNNVSFTGEICSLDMPFVLDATFPGGAAKTSFVPSSAIAGSTTVSGGGGGCSHSGGGNYSVTIKEDGSGTLTWTTTDKLACPGFANSRTATFTLPLQLAPELSCP
jgi:hypothetical protein